MDNVVRRGKGGAGGEDMIEGDEKGEYDGTNKSNPVCDADIIQCIGEIWENSMFQNPPRQPSFRLPNSAEMGV